MKKFFILISTLFLILACQEYDPSRVKVRENALSAFGVDFGSQDWMTAYSGRVTIKTIPEGTVKIQVLVMIDDYLSVLTESSTPFTLPMVLSYDAPKVNNGIYVAYIDASGSYQFAKVNGSEVESKFEIDTRFVYETGDTLILPTDDLYLTEEIESYASLRGWNKGEKLYTSPDIPLTPPDYSEIYKESFRFLVFSYFKNGRAYNNLNLVKESGYWNEKVYPITTGDDPIILSPVYRNDGGYQEIDYSDLYYYYFRESDLGDDPVSYLESLPKYRACEIGRYMTENDKIEKSVSFALIYWGDGKPEVGKTKGSFYFPPGYKIGFMIRANTTVENKKKQGELYGDGRLNNSVNGYGNFKSSKLGVNGPRMAWLTVNGKMLLCCESGTDADFNDIIFEVEGGIEELIHIPDIDPNSYLFCYEDREIGDYDMNDVVIRGRRLSDTIVEWSLMASGGTDELYINNVFGSRINNSREIHSIFGKPRTPINVAKHDQTPIVKDTVTVKSDFSFLDINCQPWIYNKTLGWEVYISQYGQDPHAIVIPYALRWPLEAVCINRAYQNFNNWGMGKVSSSDWYKFPVEELVY